MVNLLFAGHNKIAFNVSTTKFYNVLLVCSLVKSFCSKSVSCVHVRYSDGSVVSFQKTAVAVLASVVVFLKTAVAVLMRLY